MPGTGFETLVVASGNAGKLRELGALLGPLGFCIKPQSDWAVPAAEENAQTFVENALLKARHAARLTGCAAIADDSGLVVPALGGVPGIRSARYAGLDASDADNNRKLLESMAALSGAERQAFFYCAMVFLRTHDDPVPIIACAHWWGEITDAPRGRGGFGYDPLFRVPGEGCTSAELDAEAKNRLSHRGQAARQLRSMLAAGREWQGAGA